jgi:hypothetical protein
LNSLQACINFVKKNEEIYLKVASKFKESHKAYPFWMERANYYRDIGLHLRHLKIIQTEEK